MSAVLHLSGVRKAYVQHLHGGLRMDVLRGIDLDCEAGTCTVIQGPSGSGKSSLLRCVFGAASVDAGAIELRALGRRFDIAVANEREILEARRTVVSMATQFLSVVPRVSAIDLVMAQGLERSAGVALLERLGLGRELHELPPATFSGGQRQMLNLALSLAQPRALILLDEVTASLDPERRALALDVLLERKRAGATLLAVFHDVPQAAGFVDRVVSMRDGKLAA